MSVGDDNRTTKRHVATCVHLQSCNQSFIGVIASVHVMLVDPPQEEG